MRRCWLPGAAAAHDQRSQHHRRAAFARAIHGRCCAALALRLPLLRLLIPMLVPSLPAAVQLFGMVGRCRAPGPAWPLDGRVATVLSSAGVGTALPASGAAGRTVMPCRRRRISLPRGGLRSPRARLLVGWCGLLSACRGGSRAAAWRVAANRHIQERHLLAAARGGHSAVSPFFRSLRAALCPPAAAVSAARCLVERGQRGSLCAALRGGERIQSRVEGARIPRDSSPQQVGGGHGSDAEGCRRLGSRSWWGPLGRHGEQRPPKARVGRRCARGPRGDASGACALCHIAESGVLQRGKDGVTPCHECACMPAIHKLRTSCPHPI